MRVINILKKLLVGWKNIKSLRNMYFIGFKSVTTIL